MSNLNYRAVLEDGDASRERPLQILGNSLEQIEEWAKKVLNTAIDGAVVNVFQTIETQIKIIPKPKPELKADARPK